LESTKRVIVKGRKVWGSKTHELRASNISRSEALAVEGSPGASFGVEVLEESSSSKCFLFLSRLGSPELAGGGDTSQTYL
jgi:hypothetical protein